MRHQHPPRRMAESCSDRPSACWADPSGMNAAVSSPSGGVAATSRTWNDTPPSSNVPPRARPVVRASSAPITGGLVAGQCGPAKVLADHQGRSASHRRVCIQPRLDGLDVLGEWRGPDGARCAVRKRLRAIAVTVERGQVRGGRHDEHVPAEPVRQVVHRPLGRAGHGPLRDQRCDHQGDHGSGHGELPPAASHPLHEQKPHDTPPGLGPATRARKPFAARIANRVPDASCKFRHVCGPRPARAGHVVIKSVTLRRLECVGRSVGAHVRGSDPKRTLSDARARHLQRHTVTTSITVRARKFLTANHRGLTTGTA